MTHETPLYCDFLEVGCLRFLLIEALVASAADDEVPDDEAEDDEAEGTRATDDAAPITVRKAGGSIWEWRGWGTNAANFLSAKESCHTSTRHHKCDKFKFHEVFASF